jgi:signal transduction histidine kinase
MILVSYDAQQIEQVLINLIHNAIQAMPNRGTLRVTLGQNDGTAAIMVEDTGTGIAPENMKRIFDPFFTTKPEGQGTGLGLSVSYGIIANHEGRIDVQSEVGKGTSFTISLPLDHLMPVAETTHGSGTNTDRR